MRGKGRVRFTAVVLATLGCGTVSDAADTLGLRVPGVLRVLASADEMPEVFSFATPDPKPGFERELVEGFARPTRCAIWPSPASPRHDWRAQTIFAASRWP